MFVFHFTIGMSVEFKIHYALVVECQWNSKYTMFQQWNVSGIQNTLCFSSGMSVEFKIHYVLVVECQWNSKYIMFQQWNVSGIQNTLCFSTRMLHLINHPVLVQKYQCNNKKKCFKARFPVKFVLILMRVQGLGYGI